MTLAVALLVAPRLYYRQRWWDRKAQTYSDIIAAVSHLHAGYTELYPHHSGQTVLTDEYQAKIWEQIHDATAVVRPAAMTGGFLVSRSAAGHVKHLVDALDEDATPDALAETTGDRAQAAKKALVALTAEAIRDLRLPKSK